MGILTRNKGTFWKWSKPVKQTLCPNEQYLGNLLYRKPEIIPMENIGKPEIKVMLWGIRIDNKQIDLIGLDEYGNITLIETKLSTNKDLDVSKKKNIFRQIDEYSKTLRKTKYEYIDKKIQNIENENLTKLLNSKKKYLNKNNISKFRRAVQENLESGRFLVLLATDNVGQNDNFINEILKRRKNGQNIYALELSCFLDKKQEIVFPRFFPTSLPKKYAKLPPIGKRESAFFEKAKTYCKNKDARKIKTLYNWVKRQKKFKIRWYYSPTFIDALSFTPYINCRNRNIYFFYLDCYGIMRICNSNKNLQYFQDLFGEENNIVDDNWHHFSLDRLSNKKKMRKFKKLMSNIAGD